MARRKCGESTLRMTVYTTRVVSGKKSNRTRWLLVSSKSLSESDAWRPLKTAGSRKASRHNPGCGIANAGQFSRAGVPNNGTLRAMSRSFLRWVCLFIVSSGMVAQNSRVPVWPLSATPKGPNPINLAWSGSAEASYGYLAEIQSAGDNRYPPRAGLRFDIRGVTNTQAIISYTAPNSSACAVEVSESPTYSPLVHDVDSSLFTGANSDSRSTSITNGTARTTVIGARLSQVALDGNTYSRALQAYTTHYFRIICGGYIATGTFTTANIPFGMTYQDIPQLDQTSPGNTIKPTLLNDRAQTIVDPHTGALIRRVSLPADTSASGPYMFFGGADRVCGVSQVGSPAIGYLCSFPNGDGEFSVLYYIIPSTGEARYLGYNPFGLAYLKINALDSKFYRFDGTDLIQDVYTGNYAAASPNTTARFSSTIIFSGVPAAIHAFNPDFVVADFGCTTGTTIGDYVDIACNRGSQDTYGWVAVLKISTRQLLAVTRPHMNIRSRWCGIHHVDPMYDQPALSITTHGFVTGNSFGGGPFESTYTGGSTLAPGSTVIAVSGEPDYPTATFASPPTITSQVYGFTDASSIGVCTGGGSSIAYCQKMCIGDSPCVFTWVTVNGGAHDSEIGPAQVGDQFHFDDGSGEYPVTIVTKTSPTSWVITPPTAYSHAPGAVLSGQCNYEVEYWKFLLDPNGTDTTGVNFLPDPLINGHADMTSGLMLMEHWPVRAGDLVSNLGQPWTRTISEPPLFGGARAQCYGNGCASHPSAGPVGQPWLTDFLRWDGANADTGTLTPKAGQVYQYQSGYASATPRYFATATAVNGINSGPTYSLLDISPATLGTGSGDSYKYCIANAPGECYAGSVKGDTFMNIPGSPSLSCHASGPCLKNSNAYGNGVLQIGVSGDRSRVISGGLSGLRDLGEYPTAKALADGSYILFTIGDTHYHTPSHLMMAKLPPFTTFDTVDRSRFIPVSVALTSPGGSAVKAVIKFGYLEQGTVSQYRCTSRAETCIANSSSAPPTDGTTDPFKFEATDAWTGVSCATNCTIVLPVLPMHVVYYQAEFLDSGNSVVATGAASVAGDFAKSLSVAR